MGRPRKPLWASVHRGFKSHTLRHFGIAGLLSSRPALRFGYAGDRSGSSVLAPRRRMRTVPTTPRTTARIAPGTSRSKAADSQATPSETPLSAPGLTGTKASGSAGSDTPRRARAAGPQPDPSLGLPDRPQGTRRHWVEPACPTLRSAWIAFPRSPRIFPTATLMARHGFFLSVKS